MADPKKSWALIVGIDEYESKKLTPLRGAAADAVAAVEWLLELGVPKDQILFHSAPHADTMPAITRLGLPSGNARLSDIEESLGTLEGEGGEGLYVILAGHAVFEPTKDRLFLCQDFIERRPRTNRTLGITPLMRYLRSMPFTEQFFFMDGCQNLSYSPHLRATFNVGNDWSEVTPLKSNGLLAAFATEMGESAQEKDGRGAFLSTILPVLHPKNLSEEAIDPGVQRAVYIDFDTGDRLVQLSELVEWTKGVLAERRQTPKFEPHGIATSKSPILRIHSEKTTDVTIELMGPNADMRSVIVSCEPPGRREQPRAGQQFCRFPDTFKVPYGTAITVLPQARVGRVVEPDRALFVPNGPVYKLVLNVKSAPPPFASAAPPPGPRIEIRLQDSEGNPVRPLSDTDYRALGATGEQQNDGGSLEHHESGPHFQAIAAKRETWNLTHIAASNFSLALSRHVANQQYVVTSTQLGPEVNEAVPAIRFQLPSDVTSRQIAGPGFEFISLTIRPVGDYDAVSEKEVRLVEVDGRAVPMPPGPALVTVKVPWGEWSEVVTVPLSGSVTVELPERIGTPPLRVLLPEDTVGQRSWIIGVGPTAAPSRASLWKGRGLPPSPIRPTGPGDVAWALESPGTSGVCVLKGDRRLAFPLFGERAFAVALGGDSPVVEPLSPVPSPEWDLLIGTGRLDVLSLNEARELTYNKWNDDLMGLSGAYAIYSQLPHGAAELRNYLDIVLNNLRNRVRHYSPDLDLLSIVLDHGLTDRLVLDPRLVALAADSAVPLFRWGVSLALDLVDRTPDFPDPKWPAQLRRIDRSLSPASAWTAWYL